MKRVLIFFTVLVCVFAVLSACDALNLIDEQVASPKLITEINTPYEDSEIRVTITELKAAERQWTDDDKITVSAIFIVENLSNDDLGSSYIKAYADDVAVKTGKISSGTAPGKRKEYLYTSAVSKDAKLIELYFYYPYDKHVATFAFEVPPVAG